jgi:hypothetical protein
LKTERNHHLKTKVIMMKTVTIETSLDRMRLPRKRTD